MFSIKSEENSCPACGAAAEREPIELHYDRIGAKEYRIVRCSACGVIFSEPRIAVGPDWYEKSSPIRALEVRASPEKDWRYRTFLSEKLPSGKLLDVGCGDGAFMLLAKERGFSVAGFDFEERMVRLARSHGLSDAESAEFGDYCRRRSEAEFDYVTLFDVLEHTPEPRWFLSQLKRLLRPGGYVVITLPNAQRPIPWVREEHDFPPHHFTRWTPGAMRNFLRHEDFEVVHQAAGHLKIRYLSDHFFSFVLMPGLLAVVRGVLFGRSSAGTISELYERDQHIPLPSGGEDKGEETYLDMPSPNPLPHSGRGSPASIRSLLRRKLANKLFRQRLVNVFKTACTPVTMPLAAVMTAYYKVTNPDCGDCLYTLARLERK